MGLVQASFGLYSDAHVVGQSARQERRHVLPVLREMRGEWARRAKEAEPSLSRQLGIGIGAHFSSQTRRGQRRRGCFIISGFLYSLAREMVAAANRAAVQDCLVRRGVTISEFVDRP